LPSYGIYRLAKINAGIIASLHLKNEALRAYL